MVGITVSAPRNRSLSRRNVRAPLALSLLVAAGASLILALGLFTPVPNTTDEAVYIELARHFSASGRFEILGVPFPPLTYGPAFIALISPIFRIAATARDGCANLKYARLLNCCRKFADTIIRSPANRICNRHTQT
jgi:hypothetical protein